MKTARIIVLGVAIAAGGFAALLAGRSDPPRAPATGCPDRYGRGPGRQGRYRHGPRGVAQRHPMADLADGRRQPLVPAPLRAAGRHPAAVRLDRAHPRGDRRADSRGKAHQGRRIGLHGRDPALRHAGILDRNLPGNRRRRLHPAERPGRRDPEPPRPRGGKAGRRRRASPARPSCRTCACWRSTRRWRRRTASASWSARPQPSSWRRARPKRSRCRASSAPSRSPCAASSTPTLRENGDDEELGRTIVRGVNTVPSALTTWPTEMRIRAMARRTPPPARPPPALYLGSRAIGDARHAGRRRAARSVPVCDAIRRRHRFIPLGIGKSMVIPYRDSRTCWWPIADRQCRVRSARRAFLIGVNIGQTDVSSSLKASRARQITRA